MSSSGSEDDHTPEVQADWEETASAQDESKAKRDVGFPVYAVFVGKVYYPRPPIEEAVSVEEYLPDAKDELYEAFSEAYEDNRGDVWGQIVAIHETYMREITTLNL